MSNKTRLILFLIVVIFFFSGIVLNIVHINKLYDEYSILETEDDILGKVKSIKKEKGTAFIDINSRKLVIRSSENYKYEKPSLIDHIQIGDSLIKKAGCDTIYLFHENEYYFFVHAKILE